MLNLSILEEVPNIQMRFLVPKEKPKKNREDEIYARFFFPLHFGRLSTKMI